jgi:phospholipid N-methyltransferase
MTQVTEYKLNFCTLFQRDDDVVIIEINEGVEVDTDMAQELVDLSDSVLAGAPFALLSNRINAYSLSFEAMQTLATLPNMVALAIVTYTKHSKLLIETQNFFISTIRKNPVKTFTDKDTAIEWLQSELSKVGT